MRKTPQGIERRTRGRDTAISQQINLDPLKGIGDLIDLNSYCKDNYSDTMWQSMGSGASNAANDLEWRMLA